KVIKSQQPEEKARALREINILSSLKSEYFPILYDYGEYRNGDENVLYVIEEYITGQNLREIINSISSHRLDYKSCNRIISSLLKALILIEPLQLVHRDIKPENIIVSSERVVLLDFGIARDISKTSLTETFAIFGPMTPGYAPPEQIKNEKRKISFRTDLFSIAVVFYEILTDHNPFGAGTSSANEVLNITISFNPQTLSSLGFNKTFDEFIFKCFEKNCHRRPASLILAKQLFDNINWEL
ncbi:MAG: serine/threonine-protein kinase, partial [Ignavibacteriaceae bacterium]|nr:serine/threonine-protein kinase [Ignavibacteriaceae bacterium]